MGAVTEVFVAAKVAVENGHRRFAYQTFRITQGRGNAERSKFRQAEVGWCVHVREKLKSIIAAPRRLDKAVNGGENDP